MMVRIHVALAWLIALYTVMVTPLLLWGPS